MFDASGKQVISIFFGVAAIVISNFATVASLTNGDLMGMFVGYGFAAIMAIVGIILASLGIKEAVNHGNRKAKGVVGLILSIIGIFYALILTVVFGGTILLAQSAVAYESSLMLL